MSREMWTFFFYRGELPKKSNNRDKTLRSSVEFDKVSPQSGIVRRERGVESRYHREVKGWSCGTMAKIENLQKVVRQKDREGGGWSRRLPGKDEQENGVLGRQAREIETK